MITVSEGGSFDNIDKFINAMKREDAFRFLDAFGRQGVEALANSTPVDTGITSNSWDYEIQKSNGRYSIVWTNSNTESGVPVAIFIQYGHATKNGGWVEGRDFINPAIRPIFDKIAQQVWERVKNG
jgi:hypothetical protein